MQAESTEMARVKTRKDEWLRAASLVSNGPQRTSTFSCIIEGVIRWRPPIRLKPLRPRCCEPADSISGSRWHRPDLRDRVDILKVHARKLLRDLQSRGLHRDPRSCAQMLARFGMGELIDSESRRIPG